MRSLVSLAAGAVFALAGIVAPTAAADVEESSAGPFHPDCEAAFLALPLKDGRAVNQTPDGYVPVPEGAEMEAHFAHYRGEYAAFDRDCFDNWEGLRPESREFLRNNTGILVGLSGGIREPFCTAFRISPTVIATAHHCAMRPVPTFRLAADPTTDIAVLRELELGYDPLGTASDLDDWALHEIEKPSPEFTWSTETFHGEVLNHNVAFVVTISQYAWVDVIGRDIDRWLEAIRFSRVNAGQVWFAEEIDPALAGEAKERCLFHRIPTFALMSGAPIVTLRRFDNGATIKRYVAGMHLRNGALEVGKVVDRSCGAQRDYNVGVRLPARILEIIDQH